MAANDRLVARPQLHVNNVLTAGEQSTVNPSSYACHQSAIMSASFLLHHGSSLALQFVCPLILGYPFFLQFPPADTGVCLLHQLNLLIRPGTLSALVFDTYPSTVNAIQPLTCARYLTACTPTNNLYNARYSSLPMALVLAENVVGSGAFHRSTHLENNVAVRCC
jgi:hypothetical protein